MAYKYSLEMNSSMVKYLGGLSGDETVTDSEKNTISTWMDSKSSAYLKYGIETLSSGATYLVIDFRDADEKLEWQTLHWKTTERRNAINSGVMLGSNSKGGNAANKKDQVKLDIRLLQDIEE